MDETNHGPALVRLGQIENVSIGKVDPFKIGRNKNLEVGAIRNLRKPGFELLQLLPIGWRRIQ